MKDGAKKKSRSLSGSNSGIRYWLEGVPTTNSGKDGAEGLHFLFKTLQA